MALFQSGLNPHPGPPADFDPSDSEWQECYRIDYDYDGLPSQPCRGERENVLGSERPAPDMVSWALRTGTPQVTSPRENKAMRHQYDDLGDDHANTLHLLLTRLLFYSFVSDLLQLHV